MNAIKQLWQDFKSEPDIWFFYAFLLTFPFSIRKVVAFYPIQGRFNEYSGIYLYLSDIFLILTLFSWIFILCHKYSLLSIHTSSPLKRLGLWIKNYPQVTPKHFLAYLGLILVLWSFLSIGWSESKSLSLFRSIKLLEFYLLAIFVAHRIVPSAYAKASADRRLPETKMFHVEHSKGGGTIMRDALKLIILGGIINSILAIWQFVIQHSIGLTFLKESVIAPNMPGVAKIMFHACPVGCSTWNIPSGVEHYVRAYGFFPHPNILGGFLLFSVILTLFYRQLFHICPSDECSTPAPPKNVPRGTFEGGWNILVSWGGTLGGYLGWKMTVLIIIQLIALILTFSKSAIIGLGIALIYIYVSPARIATRIVAGGRLPREPKLFHVEQFSSHWGGTFALAKTAIFTFFAISVFISAFPGLSPIQNQSLEERQMLSIVPRGTIVHNPISGIGQSQSVWSMRDLTLADWQFQPVHNVLLLIWSELGIIGLILFVWILWKIFRACLSEECSAPAPPKNVPRLPLRRMFHVEHSKGGGTFEGGWNNLEFSGVEHFEAQRSITLHILQGIFLGFIFILLFDHYLWDIQQGQTMLWLVIGLLTGASLTGSNKSDSISL